MTELIAGETAGMRPHRREDYITKVANVSPKPGPMPVFTKFMNGITGDDEDLIRYHQRSLGACLSGAINDHWLLFWYGTGRNGKNTLGDLVCWMMGDYAKTIPSETLMAGHQQHPTELANLRGLRLAISSEIPEGSYWNESRIKSLTGDTMISARFMRQDFFEFRRTHKHLIYGNHRPLLHVVDDAIRERLHVVPFKRQFIGKECDPKMGERLREEAPQIMAWLIEGHGMWMRDGERLRKCKAVEDETADYFTAQNTNELWLDEECVCDATCEERGSVLYANFARWKDARGEQVITTTRWGEFMSSHFQTRRSNGTIYVGVRLKTSEEREDRGETLWKD